MQCHWLLLGRENPASVPSEHLIHSVDFPTFLLPLLLHSQWKSQHGILVLSSSVFGLLTVSVVLSCFVCLFWVDRRLPFPNTRCYIMKTQTVTRRKAGITQTNTPYLCLWCGVFKGMAVFCFVFLFDVVPKTRFTKSEDQFHWQWWVVGYSFCLFSSPVLETLSLCLVSQVCAIWVKAWFCHLCSSLSYYLLCGRGLETRSSVILNLYLSAFFEVSGWWRWPMTGLKKREKVQFYCC